MRSGGEGFGDCKRRMVAFPAKEMKEMGGDHSLARKQAGSQMNVNNIATTIVRAARLRHLAV